MNLLENIESTKFQVYTRVAATKPLNYMYRLLGLPPDTASEMASKTDAVIDPNVSGVAFVHVSTAFQPDAFGLRVGMHVSDEQHLLAVDAALEYEWKDSVTYEQETGIFREFLDVIAAPRATNSTWTILEEVARSVGTTLPAQLIIPPAHIASHAMEQFERKVLGKTAE